MDKTLALSALAALVLGVSFWQWRRDSAERRHPEKARRDGDEMIQRRKDDDAGGED